MPRYVLGINWNDERSACLVADGDVVLAVQEERFDGIRHSPGLPRGTRPGQPRALPFRSIFACLAEGSLGFDDLDLVVVHGCYYAPDLTNLRQQIPIRDQAKVVVLPEPSHHLAHAAAVYFSSGLPESAILVVDCFGSFFRDPAATVSAARAESESIFFGEGNSIRLAWRQTMPKRSSAMGLGYFNRVVSMACGFLDKHTAKQETVLEYALHEPALMWALAACGRERGDWPPVLRCHEEGIDYSRVWPWLEHLGLARTKGLPSGVTWTAPILRAEGAPLTPLHADISRRTQAETERAMLHLARLALSSTRSSNLCVGGEIALNGAALERLRQESGAHTVWAHPAVAADEGNAIGAALYGWHVILGHPARQPRCRVYRGCSYGQQVARDAVAARGARSESPSGQLFVDVARRIAAGHLIGWFEGAAEFGSRTLGHRSIFANPIKVGARERINRLKGRPTFWPVAAVTTLERAQDFFALRGPSPYKLRVVPVRESAQERIPEAVHVDGTACVQTVTADENPALYGLVAAFEKRTGVAVLLHASLRCGDRPVVETPAGALDLLHCAANELDALVLERQIICRELFSDAELLSRVLHLDPDSWLEREPGSVRWCSLRGDPIELSSPILIPLLLAVDGIRSVGQILECVAGHGLDQEEVGLLLVAVRRLLRQQAVFVGARPCSA